MKYFNEYSNYLSQTFLSFLNLKKNIFIVVVARRKASQDS